MKTGNMVLELRLSGSSRDIRELLKSAIITGDGERVVQCLETYIECGTHPAEILEALTDGFIKSQTMYKEKKKYLPELLMSFLAFASGVDLIRKKW